MKQQGEGLDCGYDCEVGEAGGQSEAAERAYCDEHMSEIEAKKGELEEDGPS